MTATSAEKTGVKVGEAICDFIMLRQNRPRPRSRFCVHHAHRYFQPFCAQPFRRSYSGGGSTDVDYRIWTISMPQESRHRFADTAKSFRQKYDGCCQLKAGKACKDYSSRYAARAPLLRNRSRQGIWKFRGNINSARVADCRVAFHSETPVLFQ